MRGHSHLFPQIRAFLCPELFQKINEMIPERTGQCFRRFVHCRFEKISDIIHPVQGKSRPGFKKKQIKGTFPITFFNQNMLKKRSLSFTFSIFKDNLKVIQTMNSVPVYTDSRVFQKTRGDFERCFRNCFKLQRGLRPCSQKVRIIFFFFHGFFRQLHRFFQSLNLSCRCGKSLGPEKHSSVKIDAGKQGQEARVSIFPLCLENWLKDAYFILHLLTSFPVGQLFRFLIGFQPLFDQIKQRVVIEF